MANDGQLTHGERVVLDILAEAWKQFCELPLQHRWERQEFMHAIHDAQRLVLARPTTRTQEFPASDFVHEADK